MSEAIEPVSVVDLACNIFEAGILCKGDTMDIHHAIEEEIRHFLRSHGISDLIEAHILWRDQTRARPDVDMPAIVEAL